MILLQEPKSYVTKKGIAQNAKGFVRRTLEAGQHKKIIMLGCMRNTVFHVINIITWMDLAV